MSSITLNGIVLSQVSDRTCKRAYQPDTLSAAITPGRSSYGTIQAPALPSTNSPKLLWILSGVPVTATQLNLLESMIRDNTTLSYSFQDALHTSRRGQPPYNTNVRLLVQSEWIGLSYFDPAQNINVWLINLTAIEL